MTGRRRVQAVFTRRWVDRVPIGDFYFDDDLVAALLGRETGAVGPSDRLRCLDVLGCDVVAFYPRRPGGGRLMGLAQARGTAPAHWRGAKGLGTLARYGVPAPKYFDWTEGQFWARESDRFVWGIVPGLFDDLAYLVGYTDFLMLTVTEPHTVAALVADLVEYNLEYALACVAAGADGLLIGDDIAHDHGLMLAPDAWRELFLPGLVRLVEGVKRFGLPVVFHADGDIRLVLPDLAATGIDGLHSLKPSAGMDLAAVKDEWGHRLVLWGNLDLGYPLTTGTEVELEAAVRNTMATGWCETTGSGGGYIFGTCSGVLGADLPPQRVALMYRTAAATAVALIPPGSGPA